MDLLLARMHTGSAPTSLISPTTSGMLPSASPSGLQQPGMAVVANDMQRVMQWAGTELSLRDRKASLSKLEAGSISQDLATLNNAPPSLYLLDALDSVEG
jgi:hypothetical protein